MGVMLTSGLLDDTCPARLHTRIKFKGVGVSSLAVWGYSPRGRKVSGYNFPLVKHSKPKETELNEDLGRARQAQDRGTRGRTALL